MQVGTCTINYDLLIMIYKGMHKIYLLHYCTYLHVMA